MGLVAKCQHLEPNLVLAKNVPTPMKGSAMTRYMADKMVNIYIDFDFRNTYRGGGSGFAINDRGYVVTNHHVVCRESCEGPNRPTDILVRWRDRTGKTQDGWASVVEAWKEVDLAVMVIRPDEWTLRPEGRLAPLSLSAHKPEPLLEVLSYGYPSQANLRFARAPERFVTTVTDGVVSRVVEAPWDKKQKEIPIVQHTAMIGKGNSGGPVVDWCGRVVAVNTVQAVWRLSEIHTEEGKSIRLKEKLNIPIEDGLNFASAAGELIDKLKAADIEHIVQLGRCPER